MINGYCAFILYVKGALVNPGQALTDVLPTFNEWRYENEEGGNSFVQLIGSVKYL